MDAPADLHDRLSSMATYNQHDDNYAYRGKHSAQKAPEVAHRPLDIPSIPVSHAQPASRGYDYEAFNRTIQQRQAARKRKSTRNKVLVALAVVLLLIVLPVAVYLFAVNNAMSLGGDQRSVDAALSEAALDEPFYMLLVGSDWRENSGVTDDEAMSGDQQRADVMILARIDRKNSQVTLLSVPRDTPYRNPDGSYMKLNEVYNQGRGSALIPAVEQLTGVTISHYAEIYFSGFVGLVDSLGGVEVDVPFDIDGTDMLTDEEVFIPEGHQKLNGQQAALFARERHQYDGDEDMNRQAAIRTIVEAIVDKVRDTSPVQYPAVILNAANCIRTDLSSSDAIYLMRGFYNDVTMYSGTGPYAGAQNEAAGGQWLCYEDPQGWARVMNVVDSGGDPSEVSYSGDVAYIAGTGESVIVE